MAEFTADTANVYVCNHGFMKLYAPTVCVQKVVMHTVPNHRLKRLCELDLMYNYRELLTINHI